jgi:predicted RNase H-like nuclease (RuvC/YqgF family)
MTDATASWLMDLQIPSLLRRWDGRSRPTPVRVPELAPATRHRGDALWGPDEEDIAHRRSVPLDRVQLDAELVRLKAQIPSLRRERDELRLEVNGLRGEIPGLRQQRDELLAAAVPLSAEVRKLESKQDEMIFLRSEIQALRVRKASLDKSLAQARTSAGTSRRSRLTDNRTFHDS